MCHLPKHTDQILGRLDPPRHYCMYESHRAIAIASVLELCFERLCVLCHFQLLCCAMLHANLLHCMSTQAATRQNHQPALKCATLWPRRSEDWSPALLSRGNSRFKQSKFVFRNLQIDTSFKIGNGRPPEPQKPDVCQPAQPPQA